MRRIAAIAAAALLPFALVGQAQASSHVYTALNEKGLKQILLKKSWMPLWMGGVPEQYEAKVSLKGMKPTECFTKGTPIEAPKSKDGSMMATVYKQNKAEHYLDIIQNVYQYADVQSAEFAWQKLVNASNACVGTHTHAIKDSSGTKIGEVTVKIEAFVAESMYGQSQLIINEDVQYVEPEPGAKPTIESADEISIWTYTGAAIIEVESNKFVPKQKNWVFSAPQIATIEALALVALQRYHLYSYKAL